MSNDQQEARGRLGGLLDSLGLRRRRRRPDVVAAEYSEAAPDEAAPDRLRTLGTFGGVFTPSFLTIIGVIMYLRFSWVVGNAGLFQTLLIVVLANTITAISALSIASIGSNERMETGGAYFMVSRVLGFQTGGSIGIPLFISQALSISLYVIGFAIALSAVIPDLPITLVAIGTMLILAVLGLLGAGLMIKVQYVILGVILLSFVSIGLGFKPVELHLAPAYAEGLDFWAVFAVFFPAVTGILAGVSMSGDLKEPAKSIPRGTLLAVAAGFLVYLLVPIMLAMSIPREALADEVALRNASRWPFLVTAGVVGATLSSAIGSLLAAPRTLQALAQDGIAPAIFARGAGPTKEPLIAMVLSMALAIGAVVLGDLNAVAEVLTMFFLTTYGVLNIAAGMEMAVGNPSFRPAIRIPAWVSFLGGLACFAVMVLISPLSTAIAVVAVVAIFIYLSLRPAAAADIANRSGGVWEGYWTGRLFAIARRLEKSRSSSSKNWRPIVQLFARDVGAHNELMETAARLSSHGGALATYAMVEVGDESGPEEREELKTELQEFARSLPQENATAIVLETEKFHEGVLVAAQAAAFAGGSYNTVMLGLPRETRGDVDFARMLKRLSGYDRNIVLFKRGSRPWTEVNGQIVVWWGGQENNVRLMLILAHILRSGHGSESPIRLATIIRDGEQVESIRERLAQTAQALRIDAEPAVIVNDGDREVSEVLAVESASAALVLMGMARVDENNVRNYIQRMRQTTSGLESALLVQSNIPDVEFE